MMVKNSSSVILNKDFYYIIKDSKYFDYAWYREHYLQDKNDDPVSHYLSIGWIMGYNPSVKFSTIQYLLSNPEVATSGMNPLVHYELYGKLENRPITALEYEVLPPYIRKAETKALFIPESARHPRMNINEFIDVLCAYDVISFDIFDTLILRNLRQPTDLFRVLGMKLGIDKFCSLRIKAEAEARMHIENARVTIYDIYKMMKNYLSIDSIEKMVRLELDTEKEFCTANPYMQYVFNELLARGKKIVIVSDMYLPNSLMMELLESCQYHGYDMLLVSCDYGMEKASGELQTEVIKKYGSNKKYIHIGDNKNSDFWGSKSIGWDAYHYISCSELGNIFRNTKLDNIVQSIYSGIVNNHLYNGIASYSKEYEHGFLYGGLLVYGFCEYINIIAMQHSVDKIWFLARDMDIVYKIYNTYFNTFDNEYIVASRSSAYEISFEENTEEYIEFYFKSRANAGTSKLGDALKETDLNVLLKCLKDYHLDSDIIISNNNYEQIRKMIYSEKERIIRYFKNSVDGAKQYFKERLGNASSVLLVDVGWGATIFNQLRYFFKRHFKDIKLSGALLGANSSAYVNDLITSGFLSAGIFSSTLNPEKCFKFETLEGNAQTMLFEAMFSSNEATLLKYDSSDTDPYCLVMGHKTEISQQIFDIQKGITDFCELFSKIANRNKDILHISSVDSFYPYESIAKDYDYLYLMFSNVKEYEDGFPRMIDNRKLTTIGEILIKRGLV